ncbi:hypothetical protein RJ639_020531 [Escallonia herrerae]|uniref:Tyrosinase copper-binding domain-containing protein n=1 Tax=Escallonia herrerae TaxID=1293975 RepID=A0AA89AGQ4_9ASTE|nr:hypothetical protein RJ639_020531 [Escallonia herrerae]
MANLPPPVTANSPPFAITPSTCRSWFFLAKKPNPPLNSKQRYRFNVSCKAVEGDDLQNLEVSSSSMAETSLGKLDRRNVLLGLGGLYGAANLGGADPLALAAPVSAPDLTSCLAVPAGLPDNPLFSECCPPVKDKYVDYVLPTSQPMRMRPAAHLVDDEYVAKYAKAIELMKALPEDDPRSFMQQARIHCAYCNGAYTQVGYPDKELQVHNSWLFFPFHRWYLYFFEKIAGKLIGDPTFGIPFWNYDSPGGMTIPAMFADSASPLYDSLRNASHQPPTTIDLDYNGTDTEATDLERVTNNLAVMYKAMVSGGNGPALFLGGAFRAGEDPGTNAGSFENSPHAPVHRWTGDPTQTNREDMGIFYSAGRDPIFYCHHANVDRAWTIWKTLGGKRKDYSDGDWLNASFAFYDENAQLVHVKVADCRDQTRLGYAYQAVDIPWLKSKPVPRKKKSKVATTFARANNATVVFPVTLNKIVQVVIKRPKKSRSKRQKEEEEEVLSLEGIMLDRAKYVKFDVYINDEDSKGSAPNKTELVGSFVNLPHQHKHKSMFKRSQKFGINEVLEELEAEDDDIILVTIVPKIGCEDVSIDAIKIVFVA